MNSQFVSNTYLINNTMPQDLPLNSDMFYGNVSYSSPSLLYTSLYMPPSSETMRNPSYVDSVQNAFFSPYMEFNPDYSLPNYGTFENQETINNIYSFESRQANIPNISNPVKKEKEKKKEKKIVYINSNKDYVHIFIILLFIFLLSFKN